MVIAFLDINAQGPTWEAVAVIGGTIITILLSIVISLIAAYAKSLGSRITNIEKGYITVKEEHHSLKEMVLSEYHNKGDVNQRLTEIKDRVESLHRRLDIMMSSPTTTG